LEELGPFRFFPVGLSWLGFIIPSRAFPTSQNVNVSRGFDGRHLDDEDDRPMTMIALLQLLQRLNSPPKQTLTVLQPTPSTVQFTVSTRPVPKGLPALISYYVSMLFRMLIGGVAIAAIVAKWQIHSAGYARVDAFAAWSDAWIGDVTARAQWRFLLPAVVTVMYLVLRRSYTGMDLATPASQLHTD
jgi:hypothetical protein